MKPVETMNLTVQMPVADVLATLAPTIDDIVNQRVAEIRERQDGSARRRIIALDLAITNVSRAVVRLENSHNSRDERAATTALVAASKGLHKAFKAYKQGQ